MSEKQVPAKLKQLAANAMVESLSQTAKEMDQVIGSSTGRHKAHDPISPGSDIFSDLPDYSAVLEDREASTRAAFKILDIRKYVTKAVGTELQPVVLHHVIGRAIAERNIPLIRLVLPANIEVLDFRALDYWITQSVVPNREMVPNESEENFAGERSACVDRPRRRLLTQFHPPNEFDWFSWDKMGKIVSLKDACELFSIMKMAGVGYGLRELMLNGRRQQFWSCPPDQMPIITEALSTMRGLSRLVLRGMTDNYMMRIIGQSIPALRHLDVSFSQYVTDEGILKLFFDEVKEQSALYLIPTWIQKNLSRMWPLANTLEYFDFSWTSVTSQSRKMVNLFPGSYMFKRLLAVNENEGFAQNIFVRRTPDMSSHIRAHDTEDKFEADLQMYAGKKGCSSFMKFINGHPWRNCNVAVFKEPPGGVLSLLDPEEEEQHDLSIVTAVITPSKEEKRIHGLVTFQRGILTEIYSIFPINVNHAGEACHQLEILRGVVTDTWHHEAALFPCLTQVDIFAEPDPFLSILQFCPHLKRIRLRIIRKVLTDHPLLEALSSSMCSQLLEELWIAPGSYKRVTGVGTGMVPKSEVSVQLVADSSVASVESGGGGTAASSRSSSIHPSQEDVLGPGNTGTKHFHADLEDGAPEKDVRIEDLVQLSMSCARRLIEHCPKLRRLGNLSWWWVTEDQLEVLCGDLVRGNSEVSLLWDNMVMPGGCRFKDGKILPA